jgi:Transposase DDE domain group 1
VSVTVRLDPKVKAAMADDAWTTIEYPERGFRRADRNLGPGPRTSRWQTRSPRTRRTAVTRSVLQVHVDLKNSALAHLPSGRFTANAAWLVLAVIAFNLTRAAALSGQALARATTATIRRTLIGVPARVARSARPLTLHLPTAWPWQKAWSDL